MPATTYTLLGNQLYLQKFNEFIQTGFKVIIISVAFLTEEMCNCNQVM